MIRYWASLDSRVFAVQQTPSEFLKFTPSFPCPSEHVAMFLLSVMMIIPTVGGLSRWLCRVQRRHVVLMEVLWDWVFSFGVRILGNRVGLCWAFIPTEVACGSCTGDHAAKFSAFPSYGN